MVEREPLQIDEENVGIYSGNCFVQHRITAMGRGKGVLIFNRDFYMAYLAGKKREIGAAENNVLALDIPPFQRIGNGNAAHDSPRAGHAGCIVENFQFKIKVTGLLFTLCKPFT